MMAAIYEKIGKGYNRTRSADSRIVDRIVEHLALPSGSRILDVGAGTGSYSRALSERGFHMTALEPSSVMREQADDEAGVIWIAGSAEELPCKNDSFDGAILILCIHHFSDYDAAFSELRRVVSKGGPIVIFTYDPEALDSAWLFKYFPAFRDQIREIFPTTDQFKKSLDEVSVEPFLLPHDLEDAFVGAPWREPARYLDQEFRDGTSAFRLLDPALIERGLTTLAGDLEDGTWKSRHGHLLTQEDYDLGYVFVRGFSPTH